MAKAMIMLVAIVVIFFCIILFKGSSVVAPSDEPPSGIELPSLPNVNVKEKAEAAGKAIEHGAKVLANKASGVVETTPVVLNVGREPIEVARGSKVEVKVTRSGGDLKAAILEITPAPGSKLKATGNSFNAGEAQTTITVEAETGAQDGGVTLKSGEAIKVVPVRIK